MFEKFLEKSTNPYRFGFNGKESDNEAYGAGGLYDYGFRVYNSGLGKFLSVDPLSPKYPHYSPYQFAGNKPIQCIDIEGLEEYNAILWQATDGSYGIRIHVVKADGPLKVNYYVRQQAATQPSPTNPSCTDCLPMGVQPTDQEIVKKEVGKNGVTDASIWETAKMAQMANSAMNAFNQSNPNGASGHDATFDGNVTLSEKTNVSKKSKYEDRIINVGELSNDGSTELGKATINNYYAQTNDKVSKDLGSTFTGFENEFSAVTEFFVKSIDQKVILETALKSLGRSVPVTVDPTMGSFIYKFNVKTKTETTTTTTTTKKTLNIATNTQATTTTKKTKTVKHKK